MNGYQQNYQQNAGGRSSGSAWGNNSWGANGGGSGPQHVQPPSHRRGKGKGTADKGAIGQIPRRLEAGESVDIFHRYCQDPNGYFMVDHAICGIHHPSVGRTDGWTEGKITKAWDASTYDRADYKTWVEILWTHRTWYNRRGHRLDVSKPSMVTQKVPAEQVRRKNQGSEAQQQPAVTLIHVRWGGEKPVDPVTEGAGGWGQIGSTPSDNYINGWEDNVWQTLGPTYEIYSAFIQNSEELLKISAPLFKTLSKGQHIGAFYFMWPILFQDGHEYPAYVNKDKQYELMVQMEGAGIPTRFPHPSHLYKVFASKEWTMQTCLHPFFNVPLTTAVSRQSIQCNPEKAAATAMQALNNLSKTRSAWNTELHAQQKNDGPVAKGVAKLGFSWEAMDVQVWNNTVDLTKSLGSLAQQPGSLVDLVLVQEWVDFDVEMRHFIVEPNLEDPQSLRPKKIIYTVMKSVEDNCFREFDRFDRQRCLQSCFEADDAALADAEKQAEVLIHRWLGWLQAQTCELPTVVRFDILAKRTGPGTANVMTGELTELGGCFLGWPQGPQVVFSAMLRSCFKDPNI